MRAPGRSCASGSPAGEPDLVCAPGETQECLCGVGREDIQECLPDGGGWEDCVCAGEGEGEGEGDYQTADAVVWRFE